MTGKEGEERLAAPCLWRQAGDGAPPHPQEDARHGLWAHTVGPLRTAGPRAPHTAWEKGGGTGELRVAGDGRRGRGAWAVRPGKRPTGLGKRVVRGVRPGGRVCCASARRARCPRKRRGC